MRRLIKIELAKLRGYKTFWLLSITYLLLMGIVLFYLDSFHFGMQGTKKQGLQVDFGTLGIFSFPGIWQNVTYVAGYFKFFLAIIVVILISGEYEYKTIRQNIIDGMSRSEFFTSKMITMFLISFSAMFYVFIIIMILGLKHTSDISLENITYHSSFMVAFLMEMTGYLSFVFFITHLVKKAAFAIGLFLIYTFIAEPIMAFKFGSISSYLPLHSFGNLIHMPFTKYIGQSIPESMELNDILIAFFYITLFLVMSWQLIEKRDL